MKKTIYQCFASLTREKKEKFVDFIGRLNFTYPQMAEKDSPERKTIDFSRINRPTTIRDARSVFGLEIEASDATGLLTNGVGFLLNCFYVKDAL